MNELLKISGVSCYEKDGVAYLKLEDVARGLGFTQEKNGVQYVKWERVNEYLEQLGFSPEVGKDDFIPENFFYRLAMKAKNETAEKFQALVADEIIPSIRRHGTYMTPETLNRMISTPEFGIELLTALKNEQDKRRLLQQQNTLILNQNTELKAENEAQRQVIADFEPIRQYVDMILESSGTLATSQIAADYGMSAKSFNQLLYESGIQHKVNHQWILYRKYMGFGYTDSRTINITRSDGRPDTKMQTYWTQKGRMFIYETLKKHNGTLPLIER